jgi:hypothetical protein
MTNAPTAPTPEEQRVFLTKLQRVFTEGDFSSTYKFALLIALAELAVEIGQDNREPLRLPHRAIADKFIGLYWQQLTPFSAGQAPGVLLQNNGAQAAVITAVSEFRRNRPGMTAEAARGTNAYEDLLRRVARTVSAQPITYLQNLGGHTDPFLYERVSGAIILKPGVTYCLRRASG